MTDLEAWLAARELERYAGAFADAEVDLAALPLLTEDDLKEIGLSLGPRRRVMAAIAAGDVAAPAPAPAATPAAPPRSVPERRQITVMFVDLVGSTRLSVEVDPEELAALLATYKDAVADEIAAAGGRVAKYLGDGVLAYFGWPLAQEDAAEASIRCGFAAIARVAALRAPDGRALQSRIGIATGLVVVGGEAGEGNAREDAIAGEAPNLAARLQALAPPDGIIIAETTHRQAGGLFDCEDIGEHRLNGFAAPVRAWRPLRVAANVTRFHAARAVRTSFVGRAHELSLLEQRWSLASDGSPRAVLVLGEPGMGKSRLVEALDQRIAAEPHRSITWQCSPYHQNKALFPVVDQATQAAGIVDADAMDGRLRKLAAMLAADRMPPEALSLFALLLAIPPDAGFAPPDIPPAQLRATTIAMLADWIRRIAADRPLLLLLEDAHWIDATTLELLTLLIDSAGDARLLTLITARPEFVSPWKGGADVSIIGLDRLSGRDCEGLVAELAARAEATRDVVRQIVSRSDGNPLFLEELSAAVFETHASAAAVPDSLQSSLMARLDRLGDAKRTAQVCAVLGRRFACPLLRKVVGLDGDALDASLAVLVERDIIRPLGAAHDGRFEFKHALVRDAAYESLLHAERRALHAACGRTLERDFPEVATTEPELLAQHFVAAAMPDEASRYAERAGDRATVASAYVEVIASYQEALAETARLPEGPARDQRTLALLLKLGPALAIVRGIQDEELHATYLRAEELSRSAGDLDSEFKAVWGRWYHANVGRALDDAKVFADRLVAISEQSGDEDHRLEALHCRWSSDLFRGDYIQGDADSALGIGLYDRDRHHHLGLVFGGHDPGVCALGVAAQAAAMAGDTARTWNLLDRAVALGEALDHAGSLGHAILQGLIVATVLRDVDRTATIAERMLALGTKFNVPPQQVMGRYHLAWVAAERGDAAALDAMAADYGRITTMGPMVVLYMVMYVGQLLRAARVDDALAIADREIGRLPFADRGLFVPDLYRVRGEVLAAAGRHGDALADFATAEALAIRDGSRLTRLRTAAARMRAAPDAAARTALEAAVAAMPAGGNPAELARAEAALAQQPA